MAKRCYRWGAGLVIVAATLSGTAGLQAQSAGDGFLFRAPRVTWSVRGGYALATASSDLFSFTTTQLTLQRHDFDAPTFGSDLAIRVTPRFDVVFGASYAGDNRHSEFRDWVDQDNLPIEQTTSFVRVPLMAGIKAYLTPRGHAIGRYAWIPSRYALYAGAGVGAMWYRFRQDGDFVDFQTFAVFPDRLQSEGWAPAAQGTLGLEFSLTTRLAVSLEGRYMLARANLSRDFSGFNPIDLSGASATMGFAVRF